MNMIYLLRGSSSFLAFTNYKPFFKMKAIQTETIKSVR
jgi:hypothetical protein